MSFNDSLWKTNIPHRKLAYIILYIGLVLAMLSILIMPPCIFKTCTCIGTGLILVSSFYLAYQMFHAGFRRNAILIFASIVIVCGISISGLIVYRNLILEERYESNDIELKPQLSQAKVEILILYFQNKCVTLQYESIQAQSQQL